ncbi:hypothetical protein DVH24_042372 [Malus domestica]|uniref:Uncharacterized protein n=1 Tax=Malus domestica TaxID=3750 RepID=A0A498J4B4_MALDO|nr:hypothetical protein DVH24_042372 [Malus domestica]
MHTLVAQSHQLCGSTSIAIKNHQNQRFNEFGVDGGPAAKDLAPKFNVFKKNLSTKLGVTILEIDGIIFASGFLVFGDSLLLLKSSIVIMARLFSVRGRHGLVRRINHRIGHRSDEGSGNPKRSAYDPTSSTRGQSSSLGSPGSRDYSLVFGPGREDEYDLMSLTDVQPPNPDASN